MKREEPQSFLKRLQSADERTKTRYLVVLSALSVGVVVFVWLKYFNTLIAPPRVAVTEEPAAVSFKDSAKSGLAFVYRAVETLLGKLGDTLAAPRSYLVEPP